MKRGHTVEKYFEKIGRIKHSWRDIALTTDIIVGFPGETNGDYQQTRGLVEEVQFDNAFVFRYSPRRDTPAAEMADQVAEEVKEWRNQDLLQVVNESARRLNDPLVGRTLEVLCEGPSKTNSARLTGRTRTNKIVNFEGSDDLIGALVDVRIERVTAFSLYGEPAEIPTALAACCS
jgi:tRNA-2-methylthio-N6-dimethylallyladenosine synthase